MDREQWIAEAMRLADAYMIASCADTAGAEGWRGDLAAHLRTLPAPAAGVPNDAAMHDEDASDVEAVIACLGDDAAQLREENDEDERATNMDRAAELLRKLLDSNAAIARLLLDADREGAKDWARGVHIHMDTDGALTAGAAPAEGWRPIESAPKDGREIILRRGARVGAAQWLKWPDTFLADGSPDGEGGEGWSVGFDGDTWDDEKAPTHWRPLPAAPGAASHDPAPPHEGEPDAILKRGRYAVGGTYWDVLVLNQDLPDGTPLYAHPAPAQGERDAKDAARYRWLRSKVGMTQTRGSGPASFVFLNMPQPTYIAPNAAVELDAAIDAAMSSEGSNHG